MRSQHYHKFALLRHFDRLELYNDSYLSVLYQEQPLHYRPELVIVVYQYRR